MTRHNVFLLVLVFDAPLNTAVSQNSDALPEQRERELTFPTQLRTFVTLGSELGGKAPRPIL